MSLSSITDGAQALEFLQRYKRLQPTYASYFCRGEHTY